MYTLGAEPAKLNEIDPQAWLARHSFQDRRHAADPARQTPALELDVRPPLARRRLTAALPEDYEGQAGQPLLRASSSRG